MSAAGDVPQIREGSPEKSKMCIRDRYLAVDEFSWSKKPQPHMIRRQIVNLSIAGDFHIHLFPNDIPVNLSNPRDLRRLRELFPGQEVYLVVGSDVVGHASAYQAAPVDWSVHSLSLIHI